MHLVIRRQAQAKASVRMHSVRAYVMPYHIVTLQNKEIIIQQCYINWSEQHFETISRLGWVSLDYLSG